MATDLESALAVAMANPKAALKYVRNLRRDVWLKAMSTPELWTMRAMLAREAEKPKAARSFTPREVEVFLALDQRRAAGELMPGAKHLLDPQAFRAFALANRFPLPGQYLQLGDGSELIAADLLSRYGWIGDDAGIGFDDWAVEHQREMLEVMKQVHPLAIVKLATVPTARNAMTGRGCPVHDDGRELRDA